MVKSHDVMFILEGKYHNIICKTANFLASSLLTQNSVNMIAFFHAFVFVINDLFTPPCLREIRQIAREAILAIEDFQRENTEKYNIQSDSVY